MSLMNNNAVLLLKTISQTCNESAGDSFQLFGITFWHTVEKKKKRGRRGHIVGVTKGSLWNCAAYFSIEHIFSLHEPQMCKLPVALN